MNKIQTFALSGCFLVLNACAGADDMGSGGAGAPAEQAPVLSKDEQVAIIQKRFQATNSRDWDTWQSLHTDDATRIAPEFAEPLQGSAAMRAAIETLSTAFPDYHLELKQAISDGEWLAVRVHTTGTMTGPLFLSSGVEVPPTGRTIEQDWTALVRFEGGLIAEFDEFYDQYTLMVQLGVISE
jgi:ketosteroid isomerase-like protein